MNIESIDAAQFWASVHKDEGGCWLWTRCCNSKGYGHYRGMKAHRIAYELCVGPIPGGMFVCHRCDVPACCNPAHLFVGTNTDNQRDMYAKGRGRKATGLANGAHTKPERRPKGDRAGARVHPEAVARGERHGMAKLSAAQVAEIRERRQNGEKRGVLSREYSVCVTHIDRIVRGGLWRETTA